MSEMQIEGPLVSGIFMERPNRFITLVSIDGEVHRAHLADPGRLKELLVPGVQLLLRRAPKDSKRKTKYSVVMMQQGEVWVSLVTTLANRFVATLLKNQALPFLAGYELSRREVPYENHRFDFLLQSAEKKPLYLEVKSVTHVVDGLARFPDAVSARATAHVRVLTDMRKKGIDAAILFVCQRADAQRFAPMWEVDSAFAEALCQAKKKGVEIYCINSRLTPQKMTFGRSIPVSVEHKRGRI